ncbi:MAG: DNA-binding response regulator [Deltaproteobacteria bacterium RBG_13_43_22]|nr:MAG: DNA-binding response regulator [Deltaproteobacteria bacterium RBG_13_43_22]
MAEKIRILLADDHQILREGLKFILDAQKDIIVTGEVADGRQAVREARRIKPDVLIMDIAMPELNGIEATRQIIEECPSVKVIILSMHYSTEHIYQALLAGARGFVIKDSAGKELIQAIRAVYGGHRFLSEKVDEVLVEDYLLRRHEIQPKTPLENLSPREREILQLVAEGKTSAAIADILFISQKTVETYRSRMMQKLDLKDTAALVKFAITHGLTGLD